MSSRCDEKKNVWYPLHTIYTLLGSTISNSTTIASTTMIKEDVTKPWHMRLGHMSEKGIDLLSKRGMICGQSTNKV